MAAMASTASAVGSHWFAVRGPARRSTGTATAAHSYSMAAFMRKTKRSHRLMIRLSTPASATLAVVAEKSGRTPAEEARAILNDALTPPFIKSAEEELARDRA